MVATLLYYFIGPHINRTHFESFKLTYQLAILRLQYSSKQGELKNIEEAEIVKQTVTKTISAKARIINPKDVKKLNK